MQSPGWWTYSWPGLPGLWYAARWRGLAGAVTFSVLLNVALLVTFVPAFRADRLASGTLWTTAAIFWVVSAWNSHLWAQRVARLPKSEDLDRIFVQAQGHYVRGHWVEAERTLRNLLGAAPHDPEARLLLIGVLRRSGRPTEAHDELAELASRETSARWAFEIARERARLSEAPGSNAVESLCEVDGQVAEEVGPKLAALPTVDVDLEEEVDSERDPESNTDERRKAA